MAEENQVVDEPAEGIQNTKVEDTPDANIVSEPKEDPVDYESRIKELEERINHKESFIRKQQSEYDKLKASLNNSNLSNKAKEEISKAPDPSTYTDEQKYLSDLVKWEISQQNLSDKVREEINKTRQYESIMERKKKFDEESFKLKKELPDFDTVARSEHMMSIYNNAQNDMASIIEGMDNGPQIAYYLGNNTDVAYKLASMHTSELVPELMRLSKLAAPKGSKKISNANSPISPVNSLTSDITEKNPDDLSYEDWKKWRMKHMKKG